MRIARLSNGWLPISLVALCVFAVYSNIYSFPFVFDDNLHLVEKGGIGSIGSRLTFAGLQQPRGIVYLTFALNHHFGGLNVFGYHLVNVLIHMTNGVLAYFLSLAVYGQLAPSFAKPAGGGTVSGPKTKRKNSRRPRIRSVKGGDANLKTRSH